MVLDSLEGAEALWAGGDYVLCITARNPQRIFADSIPSVLSIGVAVGFMAVVTCTMTSV